MLLPSSEKICIIPPMTLLRYVFGILVGCLPLYNVGCVAMQSHPQQQFYHSAQAGSTHQHFIQQASYTTENSPQWLTVSQHSQISAELHQPWNLNEFPVRSGEPGTPYRLVSDVQPADQRTPPPPGGMQHLLTPRVPPPAPARAQSAGTQPTRTIPTRTQPRTLADRMPIFGIGKYLRDEFRPSNDRVWWQNHAVLQTATFNSTSNGNFVTVHNVRFSRYESRDVFTTQYYDATFNLDDIRTIDLIMIPFQGVEQLAHVESSFGFACGRYIGMSIEARYEEGERYDPAAAGLRQFELIYSFADERDTIRMATDVNGNNVFIYRLDFEPHEVRAMFVDALQRANKLATSPEFYHPLTNSCVTNLLDHINKGRPGAVPRGHRTVIPGLLDRHMYDLGLVRTSANNFREARELAKVNWFVERYGDLEYFSAGIRQNMH